MRGSELVAHSMTGVYVGKAVLVKVGLEETEHVRSHKLVTK